MTWLSYHKLWCIHCHTTWLNMNIPHGLNQSDWNSSHLVGRLWHRVKTVFVCISLPLFFCSLSSCVCLKSLNRRDSTCIKHLTMIYSYIFFLKIWCECLFLAPHIFFSWNLHIWYEYFFLFSKYHTFFKQEFFVYNFFFRNINVEEDLPLFMSNSRRNWNLMEIF